MIKVTLKETIKHNYSAREAFKSLRTNLLFCGSEIKTIVLTSCVKNEGKSTVSIELAKSLAENGKKVILIDTDMRKSILATKYAAGQVAAGLSQYLSGQADEEEILCSTQYNNFYLVFAGCVPPNPVELLGTKKFEDFMIALRGTFDYVIIDAPPLGQVIDAAVTARLCDGAILVVGANEVSYHFAQSVKEQLEKSDCRILGAILNRVPIGSGSYYRRYYYSNYYSKYYKRYYKGYSKYGGYNGYNSGYYGGGYYGSVSEGAEDGKEKKADKPEKKK